MLRVTDYQAARCFLELRSPAWTPFRETLADLVKEETRLLIASRDDKQTHRLQGRLDLLYNLLETIEKIDYDASPRNTRNG